MENKSFVGEKSLAFSSKLGLAISFALHVFLGSGFIALNLVTTEQEDFESLEAQSLEVNSLSAEELQALVAILESDPEVSRDGTNLPGSLEPKPEPKKSIKAKTKDVKETAGGMSGEDAKKQELFSHIKELKKEYENQRYRLNNVSMKEIKDKYPDKIVDAYAEDGRLVIQLDTCRIKFDERIKQQRGNKYGAVHTGKLVESS